jgi:predicted nucleic acid-binding protein
MKYVLDSSVAFKYCVLENDSAKATALIEEYRKSLHDLISPDLFSYELAHALTRAERQKRMAVGDAELSWVNFMTDPPYLIDAQPLINRAIGIASHHRIGVYDCVYVALAEREACELLTADAKLVSNLQKHFPFIVELSTLP